MELSSTPGIGGITAITILTELGNIDRFKALDRLNSFIGLVPSVYVREDTEKVAI
jgi:transposase